MQRSSKPLKPTQKTYRLLYGKSSNRCAFPKCPNPITDGTTLLGEAAHIKAESAGGPRYDPAQTPEERRAYENLLLLCGVHHKFVDDDEKAYTVERLQKMKREHESKATEMDESETDYVADLLVAGDLNVTAINPTNSITAGVFHQTINHYGSAGAPQLTSSSYTGMHPKNGEGRYRKKGLPLGRARGVMPFDSGLKDEIFDEDGACFWFRLLPDYDPKREWTTHDLTTAAGGYGGLFLTSIRGHIEYPFVAPDGIGRYMSVDVGKAYTSTFFFRKGEIWSIDSQRISNWIPISEIRLRLPNLIEKSVQILERLGLEKPYQCIVGLEDVEGFQLVYDVNHSAQPYRPPLFAERVKIQAPYETPEDIGKIVEAFSKQVFAEANLPLPAGLT
jgi:hypothetical protein